MSTAAPPVVSDNGNNTLTIEEVEAVGALPAQFKKGWKTTEFWGAAVAASIPVVGFVANAFGVQVDTDTLMLATTGFIPYVAYILNRGFLKGKRAEALGGVEQAKLYK